MSNGAKNGHKSKSVGAKLKKISIPQVKLIVPMPKAWYEEFRELSGHTKEEIVQNIQQVLKNKMKELKLQKVAQDAVDQAQEKVEKANDW